MNINTSSGNTSAIGRTVEYYVSVGQNLSKPLNNVVIKCKMPDGLKFETANENASYDENTKTITWNFETLTSKVLTLKGTVQEFENGVYQKDLPLNLTAKCNESNETFTSNTFTLKVAKQAYSISQISTISGNEISSGEEITYVITVKNIGGKRAPFIITDVLPTELQFINYTYTRNGNTVLVEENTGNSVKIMPSLDVGETLSIYLTAKATDVSKTKEITNRVSISSTEIENLEANEMTHTLIGAKASSGDDKPEGPTQKTTYRISGTAWLDENKDGKRDNGESLLPKIKVYLLDSNSRRIVKETETNDAGVYTFEDIERGNYLVAFAYDTNKYDLTTYQANNVDNSINSDVIKMDLKLNGENKTYAVTNTISLNNNTYNVDLGLVDDPKFDLELTKGIDLVQVSNSAGTKSYKFEHADIAKIEIPEKNMNGSVIAITYSFKVKNTGAVSGYVSKIVDYKSKDLSFNSALNPEWYQNQDGTIYNTSLNGMEIKPGEAIEVSLILTKTMTNENTGISSNLAEIAECSNDLGLEDIDSVPGNRNTSEDDLGKADIIVAIKTGGPLFYGGILLLVLAIFALRCLRNK